MGRSLELNDNLTYFNNKRMLISSVGFGIAEPVRDGKIQATNLPWLITETTLDKDLAAPVWILNDLTAKAHAVPYLDVYDLLKLNSGKTEKT